MPNLLDINRGKTGKKSGELAELVIEILIRKYCAPGTCGIDVGAADGRMTRCFCAAVGSDGLVVAFEPLKEQYNRLRNKFSTNACKTIVIQAAVSNKQSDKAIFHWVKDRRWISSLSGYNLENYQVEKIEIPLVTIDDTLEKYCDHKVSLIKLDIEGAEFNALQGAINVINKYKPLIIFENGLNKSADQFGYSKKEFFDFFASIGYSIYDVFGTRLEFPDWDDHVNVCWNFVAIYNNDPRLIEFNNSIKSICTKALSILELE